MNNIIGKLVLYIKLLERNTQKVFLTTNKLDASKYQPVAPGFLSKGLFFFLFFFFNICPVLWKLLH